MTEPDRDDRLLPGGEASLDRDLAGLLGDYMDRQNAGEVLDEGKIAAEHPDLAPELLRYLEALQLIGKPHETEKTPGVLGDYRLIRQVGRGGMGIVYEAWQGTLDRRVALKVLPGGLLSDSRAVARFIREAKVAARLQHPNIVSVFGMEVQANTPYFAMQFVEGETLAQILARLRAARTKAAPGGATTAPTQGRFLETEVINLAYCAKVADAFAGVAEGLQHAHQHGIIHRDLKPSNLICDRGGRLRILDFGLARLEGQESLTLSGDFVGTPLYMSPEQALARRIPIDHRTDIYSLGATLYEVLTWGPPFRGKDHQDTLSQIITRDPPPMHRGNERIPRDLETIVLKCLRKEPQDRYGTAEALAQDLRRFVRGDPIEARPQPAWEKIARRAWCFRARLATIGSLLLLVFLSVLLVRSHQRESERRGEALYKEMVLGAVLKLEMGKMNRRAAVQAGETEMSLHAGLLEPADLLRLAGEAGLEPLEAAVRELEEAAALVPGRPEARYHRSRALALFNRDEEALVDLGRALGADGQFVPALALRASILEKQGRSDEAKARMDALAGAGVKTWANAWLAARRAAGERRWREAAAAYGRLIEKETAEREAYSRLS